MATSRDVLGALALPPERSSSYLPARTLPRSKAPETRDWPQQAPLGPKATAWLCRRPRPPWQALLPPAVVVLRVVGEGFIVSLQRGLPEAQGRPLVLGLGLAAFQPLGCRVSCTSQQIPWPSTGVEGVGSVLAPHDLLVLHQ